MFRICKVASILSKNARPIAYHPPYNLIVTKHVLFNPAIYFAQGVRHYSRKWDDDDDSGSKGPCKPREKSECKPPPKCPKRQLPQLQECAKPNIMSDCPRPACPHDAKKDNKRIILSALLALAVTLGALYYLLSRKTDKEVGTTTHPTKRLKRPTKAVKIPDNSKDIPNEVPYLLIGGGTAAFAAFRAIKSNDPTAQVLVISNEEYFPYMRPPLSKEMWFSDDPETVRTLNFKQWNGTQRSLYYEPSDFYVNTKDLMVNPNGGVAVARGWNVTHLDVANRKAFLEDGREINYTKCLIATGSLPKSLDVFENAQKAVLNRTALYRTVFDYQCIADRLEEARSVAIIGGGFLGSELACAFARRTKTDGDFRVYQVFKEGGHMGSVLPEYLSFWTTEKVKGEGVEVLPNSEVVGVSATENCVQMKLSSGRTINAELVIVAVGAAPNVEMAEKSGLEVDPDLGGFLVNTELQARSHLYVAGDAACFYDPNLGRRRIEHHDNAVISGRLAGENMTGAAKPYIHQSMFWSDLGPDIGYEAIGIVHSSLPTVGVFAKTATNQEATPPKLEVEVPEDCLKYMSKAEEELALANKEKNAEIKRQAEERRKQAAAARPGEDFSKGVIFYLRDDIIVGIVLWNVFNRMSVARQVLKDQRKYADLNEVAKLFNIHEE